VDVQVAERSLSLLSRDAEAKAPSIVWADVDKNGNLLHGKNANRVHVYTYSGSSTDLPDAPFSLVVNC
jgi:hypothetical protein